MNDPVIVTVLVENSVYGRHLKAEHGLALHVQAGSESLLFDTGQSDLIVQNARALAVDLSRLHAVVLSHGHYDHTGGLRAVSEVAPQAALHAHPAALASHFVRSTDGAIRDVGITKRNRGAAWNYAQSRAAAGTTEVAPGVFLTGEIPRETDFETTGEPFVLDEAGTKPDPVPDDQALFFDTRAGLVVLLGCAHAGVVNTLRQIRRLVPNRPFHAVMGGLHLLTASEERVSLTIAALRELGVERLAPAHCTGDLAKMRLRQEFQEACTSCSVGSRFAFPR